MARIPEAELERLKRETSLQRLVEGKGVKLERHGADLIGLCPFHNDTSPSLVVSPSKNLWHCLGACQAGGSVIDWVMRAEGVSFRHAVELLRAEAPSLAATGPVAVKMSTVRKLEPVVSRDADDQAALRQVVDFYHATLKQSPEALAYLQRRGLGSAEMIDRFQLGFSNRTLGYRLPAKNRQAGAELRGRLAELGILRPTGHELFRGSITIPVLDEHDQVLTIYGRKICDKLHNGTPVHLYLPGRRRGVWNEAGLAGSGEVILCEALLDALTFWCAGFRNVTTAYGVEGFGADHVEALKAHGIERVLIAYDRDEAGERAAMALAKKLGADGFGCFRVVFPKGMDANEYALKVKPAEKSLRLAIANAQWLGEGPQPRLTTVSCEPVVMAAPVSTESVSPTPAGELKVPLAEPPQPEPEAMPVAAPAPVSPPAPEGADAGDELVFAFGPRRWRVRGLSKNTSYEVMRVNVLCSQGEAFHVDTFDLYAARAREQFLKQVRGELGVDEADIKRELGRVLLGLEQAQHERMQRLLEPQASAPSMSEAERDEALELLHSPDLLDRILVDFERCGVVGEETNKLVGYLAAVSRKLEEPLAVVIQSSSAAGKSALMEAILALVPEEERVKYSAMTGQSLFYMGEMSLKHKVMAIVEEEGAERAAYALKLLQSEGELTIASTGKDPATGRLVTHEYHVEGPVAILLTTTAVEIDEELLNRCLVLTVNEEREQTRAIHQKQREAQTLEGLMARKRRKAVLHLHRNAQRLLKPLLVANPFAERLTFLDSRTRMRRDHQKYLTLINAVALMHQYQRPTRTGTVDGEVVEYIEVTQEDIALANKLAHQVLGRSLDELPPQTRRLLELLDVMVTEACGRLKVGRGEHRFSRREVREHTGWSATQVRAHLERLVDLEYVLIHRGRRGQSFVYELAYDGHQNGAPHLDGLTSAESLASKAQKDTSTIPTWRGSEGELAGGLRAQNGGLSGGWRGALLGEKPKRGAQICEPERDQRQNAHQGTASAAGSYVPSLVAGAR